MNTANDENRNPHPSDLREKFRARLIALGLPPKTHPYLENWAESFMKARGYLDAHSHQVKPNPLIENVLKPDKT
jgi:hypothetical protein